MGRQRKTCNTAGVPFTQMELDALEAERVRNKARTLKRKAEQSGVRAQPAQPPPQPVAAVADPEEMTVPVVASEDLNHLLGAPAALTSTKLSTDPPRAQLHAAMAHVVTEEVQATVDALVDAVRQRDALMTFYYLEQLAGSGRRALSYPDTATNLSALETAVLPLDLDEPPDVLARLENAHMLIIQVLLLAGANPWSAGPGGSAWNRAEACGDVAAYGLLTEWNRDGGENWADAKVVRSTSVRDGLENWLRLGGYDREVDLVVDTDELVEDLADAAMAEASPPAEELPVAQTEPDRVACDEAPQPYADEDVEMKPVIDRHKSPVAEPPPPEQSSAPVQPESPTTTQPPIRIAFTRDLLSNRSQPTSPRPTPSRSHSPVDQAARLPSPPEVRRPESPPTYEAPPASLPANFGPQAPPPEPELPTPAPPALKEPSPTPPPPALVVPDRFGPLVAFLRLCQRTDGKTRVARTAVGQHLSARKPPLYKKFGPFSKEAKKLGLVSLGETDGVDWIELTEELILPPEDVLPAPVPVRDGPPPQAQRPLLPPVPHVPTHQAPLGTTSGSQIPAKLQPLVDFLTQRERDTGNPWVSRTDVGLQFDGMGLYESIRYWANAASHWGLVILDAGGRSEPRMRLAPRADVQARNRVPDNSTAREPPRAPASSDHVKTSVAPAFSSALANPSEGDDRHHAQVIIEGVVVLGRTDATLQKHLIKLLGPFIDTTRIWSMQFIVERWHSRVLVRLDPRVDAAGFVRRMQDLRPPLRFDRESLSFRLNPNVLDQSPRKRSRSPSPARHRVVSPTRSARSGSHRSPPAEARRSPDRRSHAGSPVLSGPRASASPDLRSQPRTTFTSNSPSLPSRGGPTSRYRIPSPPHENGWGSRARPPVPVVAASPAPQAPTKFEPPSSTAPAAPLALSPPPTAPDSAALRLAILSTPSDVASLPATLPPSTVWDALTAAPTPTFTRTIPVPTSFGFGPSEVAARTLAESATLSPAERAFLESQSGAATAHYDAFFSRVDEFSKRNLEFVELGRKMAESARVE